MTLKDFIPHSPLRSRAGRPGFALPDEGVGAVGMVCMAGTVAVAMFMAAVAAM